jgi:tetratricopeptide (TPR) repeat protein
MNRRTEALAAYATAVDVDPDYSHAWNCKGNVLVMEGRHGEALQAYDRAIALEPDYPDPWEGKSRALEAMGREAEARAVRSIADTLRGGTP